MESISLRLRFLLPQGYYEIYREGKKVLITSSTSSPLIAAVNGRTLHPNTSCSPILSWPSFDGFQISHTSNLASSRDAHLLWQEVIGTVRALLHPHRQESTQTARNGRQQIVPCRQAACPCPEIAEGLAKLPPLTTRYSALR